MILSISKSRYLAEKIFIMLIGMKFGTIKNTSARCSSTGIRVCCFLTLKLFYQVVNFFVCRFFELRIIRIYVFKRTSKRISTFSSPIISFLLTSSKTSIKQLMNILILGDYSIKIQLRKFDISIANCITIDKILQITLQTICCLDFWFFIKTFSGTIPRRLSFLSGFLLTRRSSFSSVTLRFRLFRTIRVASRTTTLRLLRHISKFLFLFFLLVFTVLIEFVGSITNFFEGLTINYHLDNCILLVIMERNVNIISNLKE